MRTRFAAVEIPEGEVPWSRGEVARGRGGCWRCREETREGLRRDQRCHGMSGPLRGVLHRAVDLVVHTGDAAGEAGGREVRAVVAGFQVCDFRKTGATGGVQESAAERIDVRRECGGCAGVSHAA